MHLFGNALSNNPDERSAEAMINRLVAGFDLLKSKSDDWDRLSQAGDASLEEIEEIPNIFATSDDIGVIIDKLGGQHDSDQEPIKIVEESSQELTSTVDALLYLIVIFHKLERNNVFEQVEQGVIKDLHPSSEESTSTVNEGENRPWTFYVRGTMVLQQSNVEYSISVEYSIDEGTVVSIMAKGAKHAVIPRQKMSTFFRELQQIQMQLLDIAMKIDRAKEAARSTELSFYQAATHAFIAEGEGNKYNIRMMAMDDSPDEDLTYVATALGVRETSVETHIERLNKKVEEVSDILMSAKNTIDFINNPGGDAVLAEHAVQPERISIGTRQSEVKVRLGGRGQPVTVPRDSWLYNSITAGETGFGKTTFLKNLMVQWASAGWGFCYIDPKGSDITTFLQELPENRLEDVIWVDPTSPQSDEVVGFNLFQPMNDEDDTRFESEIQAIIKDLHDMMVSDYWGQKMDRHFQSIFRSMIRADKDYTLVDLYRLLSDAEHRQKIIAEIDNTETEKHIQQFTDAAPDGVIDGLAARLQVVVQSEPLRKLICHPTPSINITEAIADGKIILMKGNAACGRELRSMLVEGMSRLIWRGIQTHRTGGGEFDPYFLVIDDYECVTSMNAKLGEMMSQGRALDFSVNLSTAKPGKATKSMRANCANVFSFNRIGDGGWPQVISTGARNTNPHEMSARYIQDREEVGPIKIEPPSDPPVLCDQAAGEEVIEESLARYGAEMPDTYQF